MSIQFNANSAVRTSRPTLPTEPGLPAFSIAMKGAALAGGSTPAKHAQATEETRSIELFVTAPPYEDATAAKAKAALKLIDAVTGRLMPGSALVDRALAGGGETPRSILDQRRKELGNALSESSADRDDEGLAAVTTKALEAFESFHPGGVARDGRALAATRGMADFVRDSSVTAATALLGPMGGALQATGTRLFDRLMPGDRVYESNTVADLANIASTHGAIKAAGWAHQLEPSIVKRIGPLIARMPEAAQNVFASKFAKTAGEMTLDATLHLLSDTIAETGGRVAQDALDGRGGGEIARNARDAAFGAGGASLTSTLAVEVLDRKGVLPREQLVMIAETLERVSAKMGVRMAVGGDDAGDVAPDVSGRSGDATPSRPENFDAAYFLRQEMLHGVDLGDDIPGLRELRLIHNHATLAERSNPAAGRILPEGGYMKSEADVATTLALLLERMNPEAAAKFVEKLDQ